MPRSIRFSFALTLGAIRENGFAWENFQSIFPFGFLGIREGQYVQLVNTVLDYLPDDKERSLLLDLLDSQWCVLVEQFWIAHECGSDAELFAGENHFALARLQIDKNIRAQRRLPPKDGRGAIMSLGEDETLLDRISSKT